MFHLLAFGYNVVPSLVRFFYQIFIDWLIKYLWNKIQETLGITQIYAVEASGIYVMEDRNGRDRERPRWKSHMDANLIKTCLPSFFPPFVKSYDWIGSLWTRGQGIIMLKFSVIRWVLYT